jgi:hypothetical protein
MYMVFILMKFMLEEIMGDLSNITQNLLKLLLIFEYVKSYFCINRQKKAKKSKPIN